jgi:hypothetical protein
MAAGMGVGVSMLGPSGIVMDTSKAMAILGFSPSQTFDSSSMEEINRAFMYKMHLLQAGTGNSKKNFNPRKKETRRSEMRKINEALQFLTRKRSKSVAVVEWQSAGRKGHVVMTAIKALTTDSMFGICKASTNENSAFREAEIRQALFKEQESKRAQALAAELTNNASKAEKAKKISAKEEKAKSAKSSRRASKAKSSKSNSVSGSNVTDLLNESKAKLKPTSAVERRTSTYSSISLPGLSSDTARRRTNSTAPSVTSSYPPSTRSSRRGTSSAKTKTPRSPSGRLKSSTQEKSDNDTSKKKYTKSKTLLVPGANMRNEFTKSHSDLTKAGEDEGIDLVRNAINQLNLNLTDDFVNMTSNGYLSYSTESLFSK